MFEMIAPETAILILITIVAVLILGLSDVFGRLNAQAIKLNAMQKQINVLQALYARITTQEE